MLFWHKTLVKLCLIVVLITTSPIGGGAPAHCCCGALLLAPTTDVVPYGGYSLEVQQDSTADSQFKDATRFVNTEFGLARNIEVGVDFDISDEAEGRAIANSKYRFGLDKKTGAAVAVGAQSINGNFKSIPFVTASLPLPHLRLHAGALRSEGNTRLFGGVDVPVSDKLTLLGDYISGNEFFASAGLIYTFTENFSLLTYAQFPNDGSDVIYSVHFVVCGSTR